MENKQKAKRKLKGFDFAKEGAAVALVGPSVGGPANGIPLLIAKANNFSPEFIKKMQEVQVTMELPYFLEKFFYVWGEDAKFLADLHGDWYSEEDIAEGCYSFNKHCRKANLLHLIDTNGFQFMNHTFFLAKPLSVKLK